MNGLDENLSSRERQIALLAAQGLTDKEIQRRLGLSSSTVATYWKRIREKLKSVNRSEAIARILCGYLSPQNGSGSAKRLLPGAHTVSPTTIVVTPSPSRWVEVDAMARRLVNGAAVRDREVLEQLLNHQNGGSANGSPARRRGSRHEPEKPQGSRP